MKKRAIKIIVAFLLFIISFTIKFDNVWINNILYIISYIIVGLEIVLEAIRDIALGKVFGECFLMTVATIGAFAIGEFPEAVAVMLFYQVGEFFQRIAVNRSRKSISSLMDIRPDYANLLKDDKEERVDPDDVNVGNIIVVKPGEKVPLDGVVIDGESFLDTVAITGESVPRKINVGEKIISGCINTSGLLKIEVTKEFDESTVSKILELVENASNKKSKSENFITKFARYYTPIVVIIAVILAVVPTIVIEDAVFSEWLYRALSFLVVSCPCALVISIPLSFFAGIGGASKIGVLIKGGNFIEALSNTKIVALDKTGTVTKGVFEIQEIKAKDISEEELLKYAAYAENYSSHPIAQSIKKAYGKEIDTKLIESTNEIAGIGIEAKIDSKCVYVGNKRMMYRKGVDYEICTKVGTVVYVSIDRKYKGYILIADSLKDDSKEAIDDLRKNGIKDIVMLTGDRKEIGESVAKELGIDKVSTELFPDTKVREIETLMENKRKSDKLAYIGDGINDAPVLAIADVGIAMGGLGSDAAIEAADVVIMTDELSKITKAIKLSKKTLRIVKENIAFAIFVKVIVLLLSAFGISTMWEAVFADVGVSLIAILNALRALNVEK